VFDYSLEEIADVGDFAVGGVTASGPWRMVAGDVDGEPVVTRLVTTATAAVDYRPPRTARTRLKLALPNGSMPARSEYESLKLTAHAFTAGW